jgi:hypothetical protein
VERQGNFNKLMETVELLEVISRTIYAGGVISDTSCMKHRERYMRMGAGLKIVIYCRFSSFCSSLLA